MKKLKTKHSVIIGLIFSVFTYGMIELSNFLGSELSEHATSNSNSLSKDALKSKTNRDLRRK